MPHAWRIPAAAVALTVLGGVLAAACAPPTPRAPMPVEPSVPSAVASAAPRVLAAIEPTATPTSAPTAAPTASAPPPTGPGTIACGATRCRAGAELCCLGEPSRCVAAPAVPPDADVYQELGAREKACGGHRFLACDDAGDCGPGRTCCEESYETETTSTYQGTCRPLRAGRVTCPRAELCSADDGRCARKDTACTSVAGAMRCQLPLARRARPRCGARACALGMTCVDGEAGPTCVPGAFRDDVTLQKGVIECDRGRDCGEDESCFQNPQLPGRRCDFGIAGVDGLSERAYCTGAEDCVAYCRLDATAVPNCHVATVGGKKRAGVCECLTRCTKDTDCDGCARLAILREGVSMAATAFCDRRKGACECSASP